MNAVPIVMLRVFPSVTSGVYPIELDLNNGEHVVADRAQISLERLISVENNAEIYGKLLGEALFEGTSIGQAYRQVIAAYPRQITIRLWIDAPELTDLAWERLLQPVGGGWLPLGVTGATPFARFIPAQEWTGSPSVREERLRVLAAIASPPSLGMYGLGQIDPSEIARLRALLTGLPGVDADVLTTATDHPATLQNIRTTLATGYDVLHLVCHGTTIQGSSVLFLDPSNGKSPVVHTNQLVESLRSLAHPPSLVCLMACETAARPRTDALLAIGPALVVESGIPYVLAMRGQVGVDTAYDLTAQFYSRLLAHGRPDLALNEARASVRDKWDWSTPVLFTRLGARPIYSPTPAVAQSTRVSRPALSRELLGDLRAILVLQPAFQSDYDLRAVFVVSDLRPWQDSLPQAHSVQNRVDRTVAYLQDQRRSDGTPVLTLFLAALRDQRHHDHSDYQTLDALAARANAL
jgi:hypothetical protein